MVAVFQLLLANVNCGSSAEKAVMCLLGLGTAEPLKGGFAAAVLPFSGGR